MVQGIGQLQNQSFIYNCSHTSPTRLWLFRLLSLHQVRFMRASLVLPGYGFLLVEELKLFLGSRTFFHSISEISGRNQNSRVWVCMVKFELHLNTIFYTFFVVISVCLYVICMNVNECGKFVIVSKEGNISEIMYSFNETISDINLKTGVVPKYVNIFEMATCYKTV